MLRRTLTLLTLATLLSPVSAIAAKKEADTNTEGEGIDKNRRQLIIV
ncbi:MAG: hypothetical protein ACFBSC_09065 [Microcoleaceae cyanobacterium]